MKKEKFGCKQTEKDGSQEPSFLVCPVKTCAAGEKAAKRLYFTAEMQQPAGNPVREPDKKAADGNGGVRMQESGVVKPELQQKAEIQAFTGCRMRVKYDTNSIILEI